MKKDYSQKVENSRSKMESTSNSIFARNIAANSLNMKKSAETQDSDGEISRYFFDLIDQVVFDLKQFMSNRSSEVIHTNIKNTEKIEISPDGNYAFFGGNGLHVLDLTEGDYKLIRNDSDARKSVILPSKSRDKIQHHEGTQEQSHFDRGTKYEQP